MEIIFSHRNLSKKEEDNFRAYVSQKLPAIENLITDFAYNSVNFKASIEKFEKHDAYGVDLHLNIPGKTFTGSEKSHHITKAVDLSKDRLLTQLKKHLDQTKDHRSKQTLRQATDLLKTEIEEV